MDVALYDMELDTDIIIHDMLELMHDPGQGQGQRQRPSRAYIRDTKAMKATPADTIEYPNSYRFEIDMPGLKPDEITVHLEENDAVLVVSGERQRRREEGAKYLKMERRFGRLLKKFVLAENADRERISAVCEDGVLSVAVEKRPPPRPKKAKLIEVRGTGGGGGVVEGVGGRSESEASHGKERGGGGGGGGGEEGGDCGGGGGGGGDWHASDSSHGESI